MKLIQFQITRQRKQSMLEKNPDNILMGERNEALKYVRWSVTRTFSSNYHTFCSRLYFGLIYIISYNNKLVFSY